LLLILGSLFFYQPGYWPYSEGDFQMNNFFAWIDTHQVRAALILLVAVIAIGLWITHRQKVIEHLQGFVKTLKLTPHKDEYNIATVKIGQRYPVTIAGEETSFLVRSLDEGLAVFEVLVTPVNESLVQGRMDHGWAFKIDRSSFRTPSLYDSAFLASRAMERSYHVGRHAHA
ncbi:MAG: hypothetical protein WCG73_01765, partial [Candidatus Moraniibacteriota bacterium]